MTFPLLDKHQVFQLGIAIISATIDWIFPNNLGEFKSCADFNIFVYLCDLIDDIQLIRRVWVAL